MNDAKSAMLEIALRAAQQHLERDEYTAAGDVVMQALARAEQLAAPVAPEVWCGCGDKIMPDDGARCGTCVAVKTAAPKGEGK